MNTRQVALDILADVTDGAYLNLALKKRLHNLDSQDRRFVTALCFSTLENLILIDYIIDAYTSGKRIHKVIRNILRIGVCQIRFMESVPVSAAVNESVKLAEKSGKRQLKGFVNAVLRNIANEPEKVVLPQKTDDIYMYMSVKYSYPMEIVRLMADGYGVELAEALFAYKKQDSRTCIRVNLLKSDVASVRAELKGYELKPGIYFSNALYAEHIASVESMEAYKSGRLTIQGESSMAAVAAAGIAKGDKVLDVCAAPGGKTAFAAEYMPASIVAQDLHKHRVDLMDKNLERLGVSARTEVWDATVPKPEYYGKFDRVLVDAPCSALGLMYRKPDIKMAKTDISGLYPLQRDIIETCSRYVKKGGVMVYSTCTINRHENDEIVGGFLKTNPSFSAGAFPEAFPQKLRDRAKDGMLQLYPQIDEIDGFFIAVLKRS